MKLHCFDISSIHRTAPEGTAILRRMSASTLLHSQPQRRQPSLA
jgi:hypothetical protein